MPPDLPRTIDIAKVLNKKIEGDEESLIRAIEWAVDKRVDIINISAGIDRRIFLYNPCKGNCNLCMKGMWAAEKVPLFLASAGNTKDTICPARSGVKNSSSKVIAVGAENRKTNKRHKWSAKGTRYSVGEFSFQILDNKDDIKERLAHFEEMGIRLWEEKKYEEAIPYIEFLLECSIQNRMDEEYVYLYKDKLNRLNSLIGDSYLNNGNPEKAEIYYKKALNGRYFDPAYADNLEYGINLGLGISLMHQEKFQESLLYLSKSLKIFTSRNISYSDKRLFEVFDSIAFCNSNLGKFKEALRYYFKCHEYCLEHLPNSDYYYGLCLFNIATTYFKLKDSENALKFLKKSKTNIFKNKRLIDSYYELMNLINK
ncbi:MAG: S8 family serine peptidase [Trichodesmium erythraeum GBRTRLIN201]|nr:S8 family serine peptidase [Trichodesmium erythraeum GBRTRLIN201]